jgi:hypothetical protein
VWPNHSHDPSARLTSLGHRAPTLAARRKERCLFLHSRRSVTAPKRYLTSSLRRYRAAFSNRKKRRRRARRIDHRQRTRGAAAVTGRDVSAVLRTTIQTTAVTTLTSTKKRRRESEGGERLHAGALAEAQVAEEVGNITIETWRTSQSKDRVRCPIFHHHQRPSMRRTAPRNMLRGPARVTTDQRRPSRR